MRLNETEVNNYLKPLNLFPKPLRFNDSSVQEAKFLNWISANIILICIMHLCIMNNSKILEKGNLAAVLDIGYIAEI